MRREKRGQEDTGREKWAVNFYLCLCLLSHESNGERDTKYLRNNDVDLSSLLLSDNCTLSVAESPINPEQSTNDTEPDQFKCKNFKSFVVVPVDEDAKPEHTCHRIKKMKTSSEVD
jgi:hypothetical protein